jgi:hypothetical protein
MKCYRNFFILFVLLTQFAFASNQDTNLTKLKSLVKVGDWIFRDGVQVDSFIVKKLDGGEFSHIGMIVFVEPEIKVIHATTNDDENKPNQVIISTLTEFIAPDLAHKYAIVRPDFLSDKQKAQIAEELLMKQGESFKIASREQEHLYCTTLLYDAIVKYKPDFNPEWEYANLPLLISGNYLFPSAFVNYPDITWIYTYPKQ